LAWLANPWRKVYPQSGHLLTVDQAQIGDSPLAKDERLEHCAMPPTVDTCHLAKLCEASAVV